MRYGIVDLSKMPEDWNSLTHKELLFALGGAFLKNDEAEAKFKEIWDESAEQLIILDGGKERALHNDSWIEFKKNL